VLLGLGFRVGCVCCSCGLSHRCVSRLGVDADPHAVVGA